MESVKRVKNSEQIPSIYLVSILAAEKILKKMQSFLKSEKILLKNDNFFEINKKQKILVRKMEFFVPEHKIEDTIANLENIFSSNQKEKLQGENMDLKEIKISHCKSQEWFLDRKEMPVSVFLNIRNDQFHFPFELKLIPCSKQDMFSVEKIRRGMYDQQPFVYYTFPSEQYLALAFYVILNELELLRDLSWYKDIYEMLQKEYLEGRKLWEGLHRLMMESPIPSPMKRLEILQGYQNYGYMRKRWNRQGRCRQEPYPPWAQVIELLTACITPVFEAILRDEIYLAEWMPQFGRYFD